MLITNQNPHNKSIMLGVIGAPNVGKSSLVNYLMGLDLSSVTQKPQTTRNQFHCIFTIDNVEVVLVDTPGFHKSTQEMNIRMNQEAREGGDGADVNLLLLDLSRDIEAQLKEFQNIFLKNTLHNYKIWPVFTKSDLLGEHNEVNQIVKVKYIDLCKKIIGNIEEYFVVSSQNGDGVHQLIGVICDKAPAGPHLYNRGQMSNKNERFFAAEYIREQAFNILREEVPYELAVLISGYESIDEDSNSDSYNDNNNDSNNDSYNDEHKNEENNENKNSSENEKAPLVARINATILVNRQSQRAIVIGNKGSTIKEIGSRARVKIEEMVGGRVFLGLHVKVCPKWFKNNTILEQIGLSRAPDSKRVWRKR
ncbi:MAG: GTPase Era [Oligoflexia bacterium]|nr:GTPase Era [Oligoflexia bacterium]